MSNNYLITREGNFVTVSDDELYHWKYIKREKVNGKWRYYYKDDDYDKAKADYKKAATTANTYAREISKREKTVKAMDDIISGRVNGKTTYKDGVVTNTYYSKETAEAIKSVEGMNLESDKKRSEYLRKKAQKYKETFDKAKAVYEKSYGHKVADLLNKVSDEIDKAKKWVKSLL